MVWDLGFDEEDEDAVGEVVEAAGSGLVVDILSLRKRGVLLAYMRGVRWLLKS
jgi:hypothetical protein